MSCGKFEASPTGSRSKRAWTPRASRSVVVGTPGVVDPATGALSLIPNISGLSEISVTRTLAEHYGQEVAIENDVNLAVLGEAWQGCARGCENAAFLALGTGVGLGLIINGKLVRGSAGAAGEIAYLPIGAQTHSSDALAVGAFELEVGAAGILRRYRAIGSKPVATVQDVFAALAAGDEAASLVLDATAETIALAIAALQSILDAELVILGGGIGIRPELVTRVQRRMSGGLCPRSHDPRQRARREGEPRRGRVAGRPPPAQRSIRHFRRV